MAKLEFIRSKIIDKAEIKRTIARWRFKDDKIVFTNGCFDILHLGHVELLLKASELGDRLIVGLNADTSVQALKGVNRPINNLTARATMLASLYFVDAVVVFDEETPYNLIQLLAPDVLVKGGDWKEEQIVGADIVKKNGGEVHIIPLTEGYSTSSIEKKLHCL